MQATIRMARPRAGQVSMSKSNTRLSRCDPVGSRGVANGHVLLRNSDSEGELSVKVDGREPPDGAQFVRQ
jgi:hypothetical protein